MDFVYITYFEIKTLTPEITRRHTINAIQLDILNEIETQTPIPYVFLGDFTMCDIDFKVVDLKTKIEINSALNRVEHKSFITLSYAEDLPCIDEMIPF